jgi:hypothetical protein
MQKKFRGLSKLGKFFIFRTKRTCAKVDLKALFNDVRTTLHLPNYLVGIFLTCHSVLKE